MLYIVLNNDIQNAPKMTDPIKNMEVERIEKRSADEIAALIFSYKPEGGWLSTKQTSWLYRRWQDENPLQAQQDQDGKKLPAYGKYNGQTWRLTLRWLSSGGLFPYNGKLELIDGDRPPIEDWILQPNGG